jgi:porphobilinogen synthase
MTSLLIDSATATRGAFAHFRRFRRLRRNEALRRLVRETSLSPSDFIYPLFAVHGRGVREEIPSMPGQYHLSVDRLEAEADELRALGVRAVLLFGLPAAKDAEGSEAYAEDGIVQQAVRALKSADPDLVVITDVCLCEYTSHGHCGIVVDGEVDNDSSLELLARTAVSHARAGAGLVAPSDMLDGRVAAIRSALDEAGFAHTPILSYAAKYASAFYGPFREAAESTPQFGDRRGYQMDPANAREALREIEADIAEGADIVMVKPAIAYLDVLSQARQRFDVPLAAYNVSGEYAMVHAAARNGWLDLRATALEVLTSIKRAGADVIITYHAKEAARWLAEGR